MYFYHVTQKRHLKSIMKNGLIPKIGSNSSFGQEKFKNVFLTDENNIPEWYELLHADTVLRVDVDDINIHNFNSYDFANEIIYNYKISPENIEIYPYRHAEHKESIQHLYYSYLNTFNECLMCLFTLAKKGPYTVRKKSVDYELRYINIIMHYLDYSRMSTRTKKKLLAPNVITFLNIYNRLDNLGPIYSKDVKRIQRYTRKYFGDCIISREKIKTKIFTKNKLRNITTAEKKEWGKMFNIQGEKHEKSNKQSLEGIV